MTDNTPNVPLNDDMLKAAAVVKSDPRMEKTTSARAIREVAKHILIDENKGQTGTNGYTLYQWLKAMPLGTVLLIVFNKISPKFILEDINKRDNPKSYEDVKTRYTSTEWPTQVQEVFDIIEAIGADAEVTPTTEGDSAEVKRLKTLCGELSFDLEEARTVRDTYEEELSKLKPVKKDLASALDDLSTLKGTLKKLKDDKANAEVKDIRVAYADLTGSVELKPIKEMFGGVLQVDGTIPVWSWVDAEGVAQHNEEVPYINPHYIFRPDELQRVLYALNTNQRMYLHGHTGTGKTTLIEQVAAHLGWMTTRINFDSEITRFDLIGKVDMYNDGGTSVTKWQDGLLPKAMSSPTIAIFDEIDFCRPDVAYVMQAATEGNGMVILEDGGRRVDPDPMFRMFATGNTVGQGDEHGMYQGARAQSLAFLDRFTVWQKVEYMNVEQRKELITKEVPELSGKSLDKLMNYIQEHITGFEKSKVLQPLSPRSWLAIAKAAAYFEEQGNTKTAIQEAIQMTILDRCTTDDYAVLKGLVQRT